MSNDKALLQATLSKLLGFDDGADDVLDHLLSIESKHDLSEYLSQLLGSSKKGLVEFVDNVCRYQTGEPLNSQDVHDEQELDVAGEDAAQKAPKAVAKQQLSPAGAAVGSGRRHSKQTAKSRVPPPSKNNGRQISEKDRPTPASSQNPATNLVSMTALSPTPLVEQQQERVLQKSSPSRGKAAVVCGCFGTKHQALTNCLYCGRISCAVEGYGYCAFCGFMVEEIQDAAHEGDKAWLQKERLLRYDRELARRTEIFDDQADYQTPSTWMTNEENEEAERSQEDHINSLKRPKQTLNLAV